MNVLVIGAAGRTGRAVVAEAIEQGHHVTALVHSDGGDPIPGVAVRTGDASDPATVEDALVGQDAVIDTVGGKTPYRHSTLEGRVAATVVAAMRRHDVRRLVVTSMFGAGDSAAKAPLWVKLLLATFLRGEVPDKAAKEAAVAGSALDWVIVRPPFLTEKPATGQVRVYPAGSAERPHTITRSDLADFIVAQLTSDDHLGEAVTVANR